MKKYYFIIACSLILLNNSYGQITRSEAIKIADEYVSNLKATDYLLYSYPEVMNSRSSGYA